MASETPAGGFRQALQALAKPVMDVLLTGNPLGRAAIRMCSEHLASKWRRDLARLCSSIELVEEQYV